MYGAEARGRPGASSAQTCTAAAQRRPRLLIKMTRLTDLSNQPSSTHCLTDNRHNSAQGFCGAGCTATQQPVELRMNLSSLLVHTILCISIMLPHASGTTISVNSISGINAYECGTVSNSPCATLQYAIDTASDGDEVTADGGLYIGEYPNRGLFTNSPSPQHWRSLHRRGE